MIFSIGFLLTGILCLAFFFLIIYGVLSYIIRQLMTPLRPFIDEIKSMWNAVDKKEVN